MTDQTKEREALLNALDAKAFDIDPENDDGYSFGQRVINLSDALDVAMQSRAHVPADVERVAKAIYYENPDVIHGEFDESGERTHTRDFDTLDEEDRDLLMCQAKAALSAMPQQPQCLCGEIGFRHCQIHQEQPSSNSAGMSEEQLAYLLCEADGQDPHRLCYHTVEPGVQEPWGDLWMHYLPQARALLASGTLLAQPPTLLANLASSEWQPIETAPKDGTRVLLWLEPIKRHESFRHETDWRDIGRWINHNGGGWTHSTIGTPILWQPLPVSPLAAGMKGA